MRCFSHLYAQSEFWVNRKRQRGTLCVINHEANGSLRLQTAKWDLFFYIYYIFAQKSEST
jgi:hypothetical protein